MTFEIIKNTPPMKGARPGAGKSKYPFADMEVDDAFDFPLGEMKLDNSDFRSTANTRSPAHNWARKNQPEWKFSVCKINETTGRCRRNA
jgi:hypothetical protein